MNYRHVYMRIISHAKNQVKLGLRPKTKYYQQKDFPNQYFEFHHILPKSIFPNWSKRKSNIVPLTAREHFFCHQLLYKIYRKKSMCYALFLLTNTLKGGKLTSREYQKLREEYRLFLSLDYKNQKNFTLKGQKWFTNGLEQVHSKKCPKGFWRGKLGSVPFKTTLRERKLLKKKSFKSLEEAKLILEQLKKRDQERFTETAGCPFCGKSFFKNGLKYHMRSCNLNPNAIHNHWNLSEEHKRKIGESNKGKLKGRKGHKHTEEFKKIASERMKGNSSTKGMKWYTNGEKNVVCNEGEQPEGFHPGCTIKREVTEEQREHYRIAAIKRHQKSQNLEILN